MVDTSTLEIIKEFNDGYGEHLYIKPSKTGKYFISFVDWFLKNGVAFRVTDVETGQIKFVRSGSSGTIPDIDFTSDDRFVAFPNNKGNDDDRIEVWDIISYNEVYSYRYDPYGYYESLSFSNNDSLLITSTGATLNLYKTDHFNSTENIPPIQATITYPNPTSSTITLEFVLPTDGVTEISIIDVNAQVVKSVANEMMYAGNQAFNIDMTDLPSGTYFAKITAGGNTTLTKIILNK